ncbi:50 kDa hatching enzyme-like [Paramacrobiotus metropolitanus]|uniref:50 kDa hatching enzyme-like n=1 Tax=Paramacrobiotus metropolitanus TaxID=2943436 RepID=UPI002446192A|nr:50 kDa hatching enzyme-like [Paramacrobiotus metropolitanus]
MNIWMFRLIHLVSVGLLYLLRYTADAASLSLALKYLQRFGYIDHDTNGGLAAQVYREDFIAAIRVFQRFSGLHVTGRMDGQTLKRMRTPRCGNPDPVHKGFGSRAFILQGSKWDKLDLTFKIGQYSRTLSRKAVDEIIGKAFAYWSKPSGLTFTQVDSGPADIVILFARGEHGDLSPFDGPQGVLAHAFFPDFGGDTHFDDSERWTQSARNGVNLLQVAVHELGHALGLDHSDVAAAVMAPFYDGFNPKFELHSDDIAAIRRLYPLREGTTGATESSSETDDLSTPPAFTLPSTRHPFRTRFTTVRPTTSTLTSDTDAVPLDPDNESVFTAPPPSTTTRLPPVYTTKSWIWPSRETATRATTTATTAVYFEGMDHEMLDDAEMSTSTLPVTTTTTTQSTTTPTTTERSTTTPAKPKFITTNPPPTRRPTVLTTARVNATVTSSHNATSSDQPAAPDLCDPHFVIDATTTYEGVGYMFSGDYYWTISAMGEVLLPGRRIAADWGGLPGKLDAALTPSWAGGRTYFFKGSWYWRVQDRKIDSGYPKLIRASWGGVPDDLDAAFQWGKNSRTYFVKGNQIWSFDRTKLPPVRGPKPLPVDRGFPQHIDAAFRSSNGRTYLFSKDKYYAMSTWSFLVSRYYPQPTAPRWFGCGSLSEEPKDHLLYDPQREDIESQKNSTFAQLNTLKLSMYPMP